MNSSRARKIFTLLRQVVIWIGVLGMVVLLIDYSLDVSKRLSMEPACIWDPVDNPDHVPYVARYCILARNTILFRLYDASGKQLLAERTYFQMDRPNISWAPGKIWYDTASDDMYVRLPPTMLDFLRAKLP